MVTGYQRQHRKNFMYAATEGSDPQTTDHYTRLMTHVSNTSGIHEAFSKACELAAISGMVLMQPYLDFTGEDQAQGDLKVKIWEYNSFLMDPFWRNDINSANAIWCQEYITRKEASSRFGEKANVAFASSGAGTPQGYGSFYFLPENWAMSRSDLLVVSYIWYKWKRRKKRLYSPKRNQFFDFAGGDGQADEILRGIPDLELVDVEVPTWKLAVVLNDQLMYQGLNPLGTDSSPMIPVYWNYDPHISYPDLRVRSLIRPMRSPQFLFNHKVISNNDIAAATINAGWKRKVGAVANEDNLKKAGQGWDILINPGYELTDCEKIIPSAVPESDLALAQQMSDLIFQTSGINLENWSGQQDKQISSLTAMIKQAANLMVFQKYFDQWDFSLKTLGEVLLQIVLNNWNAEKVALYLGEEPSPFFYSKVIAKYQTIVEESDLTPTQQNLQAQQMLEMNATFQREVFSPSMIIPKLNITGKAEIIKILEQQEQQAAAMQQHNEMVASALEEAKLKELYSKAANNIAAARERASRSDSNVGLLEERLSEISKNQALSTKSKMEALEKLVDVSMKFGELETMLKMNQIESINMEEAFKENQERQQALEQSSSNDFMQKIMGSMQPGQMSEGSGIPSQMPQMAGMQQ